jgi:hypothetical protein
MHSKVKAGGATGAASILVVYLAGQFGLELPAEVASALTTLVSFAAGYLRRA